MRQKLGDAAVVLAGASDGKVALVATFSPGAIERGLSAAAVVREAAAVVGGGGGGRDDSAQAGGRQPERLPEALDTAREAIRRGALVGSLRMRVLAIDHGEARAGTAICDPSGTIVRPLGVISPPDPGAVARLAKEEGAELIVVGLPVSLDGTEREQAAAARSFAAAVAKLATVSGRNLRRAPDHADGRRQRPRRGQRTRRRARGRPPARVVSRGSRGGVSAEPARLARPVR